MKETQILDMDGDRLGIMMGSSLSTQNCQSRDGNEGFFTCMLVINSECVRILGSLTPFLLTQLMFKVLMISIQMFYSICCELCVALEMYVKTGYEKYMEQFK